MDDSFWISVAGLVVAIYAARAAIVTIRESNKARDLATVESLRSSLRETTIDLFEKLQDPSASAAHHDFYALQFLDAVEHAAYVYNSKMIGDASTKFMKDYLVAELHGIAAQPWLKASTLATKLNDPVYCELRKFAKAENISF